MATVSHGASAPVVRYNFNTVPLACYEHEGDLWMPGEDVGRALGYGDARSAVKKLYQRNKTELDRYSMIMMLDSGNSMPQGVVEEQKRVPAGPDWGPQVPENDSEEEPAGPAEGAAGSVQRRRIRVFNEEGVMILTMLSNQPKAAEFRAWAVKILKAYRHGELALTQPASRENLLITCIKEARFANPVAIHTLIERFGYPESIRPACLADVHRRAARDTSRAPGLVDWFIDSVLPRLAGEIRGEPGPILAEVRKKPPGIRNWRERTVAGAVWTLEHRAPDLYRFAVRLGAEEEVDVDIGTQLFTRWMGWSASRIEAHGWTRTQHHATKGWPVYHLSLAEVNHG